MPSTPTEDQPLTTEPQPPPVKPKPPRVKPKPPPVNPKPPLAKPQTQPEIDSDNLSTIAIDGMLTMCSMQDSVYRGVSQLTTSSYVYE